MNAAELQAYWGSLSARHLTASRDGYEVICYAGMPGWFNTFIHRYQMKTFERLVSGQSFAGCDVLDVGTGVGRWARWYAACRDARVTGIDIEPARLERARALAGGNGLRIAYEQMPADDLRFDDASFDVVNCVTVLQHVPDDVKRRAIAEIARVLRPGGRIVLFEVTDLADDAPHVFPWAASAWRRAFEAHGMTLRRTAGTEYIPLLRLLKRAHAAANGGSRASIDAMKQGRPGAAGRARLALLRAAVALSYPLEEACAVLPPRAARVTAFLFDKPRLEVA